MGKTKKTKEFSKKIFNIIITLFVIVIFYSMALMWKIGSAEGLMYLIPSISGLTATTVGFYYWKAKMENMIKLSKSNNLLLEDFKKLEDGMKDFNPNSEGDVG